MSDPDTVSPSRDNDAPHTPASDDPQAPDLAHDEAAEPQDSLAEPAQSRPLLYIGGLIVLIVLGVGAALLTLSQRPQAAGVSPTAPASQAAPSDPAASAPSVPTALPLPAAVGDYTSTDPIARVGDVEILRGDFVRLYQPGDNALELLNQMIDVELVVQQALAEGVTVDDEAISTQIEQIRASSAQGEQADFDAFLQQNLIAGEEKLRELLRRDLIVEQMILRYSPLEQVHARHILLATAPAEGQAAGDPEARKAEAEALIAELEAGADFAALAAEHSDDPGSQASGGDLGWAPRGLFVPEFDEAVFSMEEGELRLVQTQFGWHIIELLDEPELRPLESSDLLQTAPGQQAFTEGFLPWVAELRSTAETEGRVTVLVEDADLVALSE